MDSAEIILYGFVGLTGLSALYIVLTRNILYAAFALVLTFLGVAGIYIMIGAEFIAVSQVLIYVGGILVLIVFGIMLTNRLRGQRLLSGVYNKWSGLLISGGLLVLLYQGIIQANFGAMRWIETGREPEQAGLKNLAIHLMTDYVLAFEVVGVLLLLALIGAVKIAGPGRKETKDAA